MLTTTQVLEYLRVDRRTLYRLLKSGQLPGVRLGRQWRFRESDLERWLSDHKAARSRTDAAGVRASPINASCVNAAESPDWADRNAEEIVDRWYQVEGRANGLSGATLANMIAEALREAGRSPGHCTAEGETLGGVHVLKRR